MKKMLSLVMAITMCLSLSGLLWRDHFSGGEQPVSRCQHPPPPAPARGHPALPRTRKATWPMSRTRAPCMWVSPISPRWTIRKRGSDEWIGFDADMAKAFAESLGVNVEFQEITWDYKVQELDSKTIDCVWNGMTINDEVTAAMGVS